MNRSGFSLLELLIAAAILAILVAVGVVNYVEAQDRALMAADAANLRAIAAALQAYSVDHGRLPEGDQVAGPFSSADAREAGNGPAAGGSWNGVPWVLYELGYVADWRTLFCPKYLRLYRDGTTIRGGWPRYHNFRYAYNSGSRATGGAAGGAAGTNILSGDRRSWIVRDLYLSASAGFYGAWAPAYPADFTYPWGPHRDQELGLWGDLAVRLTVGGSDEAIEPKPRAPDP